MDEKIQRFIDDLVNRDFIVFAGSGIPRPLGICDWRELLQKLDELVSLRGINIKDVEDRHFPEIAQMIYVTLEEKGRVNDYYEAIEKALQPKNCKWNSIQWKITKKCRSIITTNLDTSFEDAINDRFKESGKNETCKYQTLSSLSVDKITEPHHVTYLHGRRGEKDIILKTADYVRHYSSYNKGGESELVKTLKKAFCRPEAIVFVGFSFEDRYVTDTFRLAFRELQLKLHPEIAPKDVQHYALLQHAIPGDREKREALLQKMDKLQPDTEDFKMGEALKRSIAIEQRLKELHIEVLRYEYDKHTEIENWFEEVNKRCRSSTDTGSTDTVKIS